MTSKVNRQPFIMLARSKVSQGRSAENLAMGPIAQIALTGVLAVLALDIFGSLASIKLNFPYKRLAWCSFLIYWLLGVMANSLETAVTACGLVALVHATVGWAISWKIGPGRISNGRLRPLVFLSTVVLVVSLEVCLGMLGFVLGRMVLHSVTL